VTSWDAMIEQHPIQGNGADGSYSYHAFRHSMCQGSLRVRVCQEMTHCIAVSIYLLTREMCLPNCFGSTMVMLIHNCAGVVFRSKSCGTSLHQSLPIETRLSQDVGEVQVVRPCSVTWVPFLSVATHKPLAVHLLQVEAHCALTHVVAELQQFA